MLVLDTNIIVSALKNPNGKAFGVLTDVLDGKYKFTHINNLILKVRK